jgi:hypothetical protein
MGFLYGKKQSMISMLLSAGLFTKIYLDRGSDWVAFLYQEPYLSHMATYLCVSIITGFVIDNKDRVINDLTQETNALREKYDFLNKVHLEANQIKDNLYEQIINTDDSIGKVYNIVRQLDKVQVEQIYAAAVTIVKDLMKATSSALYTVNKYETYLRLNIKTGENNLCANSIKIEDNPAMQKLMSSKQVFINKEMAANAPDMAAPILYQGKVFAIIQINGLPFANFTLFYENMFRIITMFITDALIRAYLHSENIREKKYLPNTNILVAAEFEKILEEFERRKDLSDQAVALLKITEQPLDYETFYQKLAPLFRAEDYIGVKDDGHVYILLINVIEGIVIKVQERLQKIGVAATFES